jgi:hypothetical protein
MAFYFITGKLGNGKTLVTIGKIKEKLESGCMVATNIDINLDSMFGDLTDKPRVMRIPDQPSVEDLEMIGNANLTYDESKNGLLVLDECGTWFNSRNWQDKSRKAVNNWFLHARKLGWDVLLIVQDISLIDAQARMALSEHTVFCRRLDNLSIPFVSPLFKLFTGYRLKLPRMHVAKVVYGDSMTDMKVESWVYRGTELFSCYDTKQCFSSDYSNGVYSLLTPWLLKGRYKVPRNKDFYMRMTRIMWKRFKSPVALSAGFLFGVSFAVLFLMSSAYGDLTRKSELLKVPVTAPVSPGETIPSNDPGPSGNQDFLSSKFSNLVIVGSSRINRNWYYDFSDDLNSDLIASSGIKIVPVSACKALFFKGDLQHEVYCY